MTALITGASSGMGRDMARYLAELGYDLILVARREDRLLALKDEIKNVKVKTITLDLSAQENCFKLYEMTKDDGVNFLVNNAVPRRDRSPCLSDTMNKHQMNGRAETPAPTRMMIICGRAETPAPTRMAQFSLS